MEEILASIRRIISEDGAADEAEPAPAPKAAKPAPKPAPVAEPEPEPEVEFEAVPAFEPEPEPEPEPEEEAFVPDEEEDILDLTEKVDEEAEPLFEEQRYRAETPPPPPVFEEEDEGLVSPPRREEAVSSFANLTSSLEARHPELPIGAGHKTLESLTKEVMRPMLKEWLDKNLPHIVERLVREEIERIARQGQRHQED